jgi:thiamine-phosphate pyrophosphorylase
MNNPAGTRTLRRMSRSAMKTRLPQSGLYAITDGPRRDLLSSVEAALRGGAAIVQYRDKRGDASRRLKEASNLLALCRRAGVPLIINDDVELAAASGADGVHLGEHDGSLGAARGRLGPYAIIGVSCYASLDRARAAAAAGADYLAFGAFFPSPTKPDAQRASPDLLRAARSIGLPLVAIGGITPENARLLIDAGADFLAAISGVFGAADPARAAEKYKKLFDADDRG